MFHNAIVDMINFEIPLVAAEVDARAGLPEGQFAKLYGSADAAYADLAAAVIAECVQYCTAIGMSRRRSTTQTLTIGLSAFLKHINTRPEQHRAVQILRLTRPDLTVSHVSSHTADTEVESTGVARDASLSETALDYAGQWLHAVSHTQAISWNTPVPLLAHFVVTTMNGLIAALLATHDVTGVQRTAALFAYYLSQHGTRNTTHHRFGQAPAEPTPE